METPAALSVRNMCLFAHSRCEFAVAPTAGEERAIRTERRRPDQTDVSLQHVSAGRIANIHTRTVASSPALAKLVPLG